MTRKPDRWISVALIVGASLVGVWACARWYITVREDAAVARLRERGAEVIQTGSRLRAIVFRARSSDVTLMGGEVGSEEVRLLNQVCRLERLSLINVRVREDFVLPARVQPVLRAVDLFWVQPGAGFWEQIARLEKLEMLSIWHTRLDPGAMERVASSKSLMFLFLTRCELSDVTLGYLSGHQNLCRLGVNGSLITEEGLRRLGDLPKLEVLAVEWCRISKPPWDSLASLPRLKCLVLRGNPIGDDALVGVSAMGQLRELVLSNTRVTDGGLRFLEPLQADLDLENTRVTRRGAEMLRRRHPWREINLAGDAASAGVP